MIILYDNNGIPIIDDTGNFILIDGLEKIKQIVYNVLTTRKGEDILNPDYGLDIVTLKSIPNLTPTIAKAIIVDAFNPDNIVGIKSLNSVTVTIENSTLYMDISVTADDGTSTTENVSLVV